MKGKKETSKLTTKDPTLKARPLHKTSFYLDLKDYNGIQSLTNDIESLGGAVETFLSKDVKCVVTNRPNWKQQRHDSSVDSSLPSTLTPTSLSKSGISPCTIESSSDRSNIKTVNSRASALLEKARNSIAKGSSDVLQIAGLWGVKVVPIHLFLNWIKKLKSKTHTDQIRWTTASNTSKLKTNSPCLKTKLVAPFLKFEDNEKQYRPMYRQFREWPIISMTVHSQSPFMTVKELERAGKRLNISGGKCSSTKLVSEGNHCEESKLSSNNSPTISTTSKAVLGLKPGYCEMCCCRYENVLQHIKTTSHRTFLEEPGFYTKLDQRIATLPDIQTLAKLIAKQTSSAHLSLNTDSDTITTSHDKENCDQPLREGKSKELSNDRGKRKHEQGSGGLVNQTLLSPSKRINIKQPLKKRFRTNIQLCEIINSVNATQGNSGDVIDNRCIQISDALQESVLSHYDHKINGKSKKFLRRALIDENKCEILDGGCKSILPSLDKTNVHLKRKVLEPRDLNVDAYGLNVSYSNAKKQCDDSHKDNDTTEIPVSCAATVTNINGNMGTKLLRSTTQRRLSSQSHLLEVFSSPTISVLQNGVGMNNSREIKSSPTSTVVVETSDRSYKACRSLNLVSTTSTVEKTSPSEKCPDETLAETLCTLHETGTSLLTGMNATVQHHTGNNDAPNTTMEIDIVTKTATNLVANACVSLTNDYISEEIEANETHCDACGVLQSETTHINLLAPAALLKLNKPGECDETGDRIKFDTSFNLKTVEDDYALMAAEPLPIYGRHLETLPDVHSLDKCEMSAIANNSEAFDKCKVGPCCSELEQFHSLNDYLSNFLSEGEEEEKFDQALDTYFTRKIALLASGSQGLLPPQPPIACTIVPPPRHIRNSSYTAKIAATTECDEPIPKCIFRRVKDHDVTNWTVHVLKDTEV